MSKYISSKKRWKYTQFYNNIYLVKTRYDRQICLSIKDIRIDPFHFNNEICSNDHDFVSIGVTTGAASIVK